MPLEEAAALAASMIEAKQIEQGLPGVAPPKTITFNGDFTGLFSIGDELWKISDDVIDLASVVKVEFYTIESGTKQTYTELHLKQEDGLDLVCNEDGMAFCMVVPEEKANDNVEKGTYILGHPDFGWLTKLVLKETIHPIDQKYLPGVCLPVVNITLETVPGSSNQTVTDEASIATLNALWESNAPACIVTAYIKSNDISATAIMVRSMEYGPKTSAYTGLTSMDAPAIVTMLYNTGEWKFMAWGS